jgi:hypothetical protein
MPDGHAPGQTPPFTGEGAAQDTGTARPGEPVEVGPERSSRPHPARDLSLHLLRMLETRLDAAGLVVRTEARLLTSRLRLKVLAGAAAFLAVWGGIVLLAVTLPPHLRAPLLGVVVGILVLTSILALMIARRRYSSGRVGSLPWLMDNLRQDLELFSRSLQRPQSAPPEEPHGDTRSTNDLAA